MIGSVWSGVYAGPIIAVKVAKVLQKKKKVVRDM